MEVCKFNFEWDIIHFHFVWLIKLIITWETFVIEFDCLKVNEIGEKFLGIKEKRILIS